MDLDPLTAYADDPMGDTVHHPYSAYNQGHDAGLAGHSAHLCPYTEEKHPRLWRKWWLDGHRDGFLDRAGVLEAPEYTPEGWELSA